MIALTVRRGELWWSTLPPPRGSGPGFRRPFLVVQSDPFNQSEIDTVVVASVTSNLDRAQAIGNVLIEARDSGLPRDSVINVSQLTMVDRRMLSVHISSLPDELMDRVDAGLRLVLAL
ncbi:MAG TPA: type II toxin-antitoxin system PemK/MazF family toxin [Candidatus Krumholzibacteria bacterium]|nr:type II toxin-antitoxin system PemK/MazF family toxin [Candidatus Krumholzibacteria bacterium]